MKLNPILTTIAILMAGIFTYLIYSLCSDEKAYTLLLCIFSFFSFGITLLFGIGVSFSDNKINANIKVLSICFTLIFFISNISFALVEMSEHTLVITNSLLLLILLLLLYIMPKKII